MPLKNDIAITKAKIYDEAKKIEDELSDEWEKFKFNLGLHTPWVWWFFGAGFTLCFILWQIANAIG